jgi:hypothetical protein
MRLVKTFVYFDKTHDKKNIHKDGLSGGLSGRAEARALVVNDN